MEFKPVYLKLSALSKLVHYYREEKENRKEKERGREE